MRCNSFSFVVQCMRFVVVFGCGFGGLVVHSVGLCWSLDELYVGLCVLLGFDNVVRMIGSCSFVVR